MRDYARETEELKRVCMDILKDVDNIVAWIGDILRPYPSLLSEDNLNEIVWSPFCASSTVTYLKKHKNELLKKNIGIVVKDCDLRALNVMFQENVFDREKIVIIGMRCDGVANHLFFEDVMYVHEIKSDDKFVYVNGKMVEWSELLHTCCNTCTYSYIETKYVIGEYMRKKNNDWMHLSKINDMDYDNRRKYFIKIAERCIRCYACREICPVCTCLECAVDPIERKISPKTTPHQKTSRATWIFREKSASENIFYLLMRAIHMSGRCVRCGCCERVCPMAIPLMDIIDIVNKTVIEKYHYDAGRDPLEKPFLTFYSEKDPEDDMEGCI